MSKYTLSVNGQSRSVDVAPDTPMLWVLRDSLGLVGTKYGCGIGECGACTIHLDGVADARLPDGSLQRRPRGDHDDRGPRSAGKHPLQQAWCELDVPQCGYCQAGQLMTAAALLKKNPRPSDADIDKAMAGNMCRCDSYVRIRAGIKRAAGLTPAGVSEKGGDV